MSVDLMHSVKGYIDRNKKKKRFIMSACALSLCTVFGVYSVLLQPAVSKEKKYLLLESEQDKGIYGEVLTLDVTASAKPEQDETCFLISAKKFGAMLADEYIFEDNVAVIQTEDGEELELHREKASDKATDYWFVLEEGKSVNFSLDCVSATIEDEQLVEGWDDDDDFGVATPSDAEKKEDSNHQKDDSADDEIIEEDSENTENDSIDDKITEDDSDDVRDDSTENDSEDVRDDSTENDSEDVQDGSTEDEIVEDDPEDDEDDSSNEAVKGEMAEASVSIHRTRLLMSASEQAADNDSGSGSDGGNGSDSGSGSDSGNGSDSGSSSDGGSGSDSENGSGSENDSGSGSGSDSGNGSGSGSGSDSGNGSGSGSGSGSENGSGSGSGSDSENGSDSGNGSGNGNGSDGGSGSGSENGSDSGKGSKEDDSSDDSSKETGSAEGNGSNKPEESAGAGSDKDESIDESELGKEETETSEESDAAVDETEKESESVPGSEVPLTPLPEIPGNVNKPNKEKKPKKELEEFSEELSITFLYTSGSSLEECRKNLDQDGYSLILTWMNEEELIKEGVANVRVEIEQSEVNAGDEAVAYVQASLTEDAEKEKIATLLLDSKTAGLSDEYTFHKGVCELEDVAGETIQLHRQKTSDKDVVQYWFTLEPGSDIEFELILTDEADRDLEIDDETDVTIEETVMAVEEGVHSEETTALETEEVIPEETTAAEAEESIPEENTVAETAEVIPEETSAAEAEESIPEENAVAEAEESIPEETTAAEAEESIPEETTAAEAEESIPEETTEAEPEESIPEETTAAETGESIPEKTTEAEPEESIPEETTAAETGESIPEENTAAESEDIVSEATPSDASEMTGSELEISAELDIYSGIGDSKRRAGTAALKKPPKSVEWYQEGTFILTCTLEDGVKVVLTAPGGAFPGAENLELSVKKLEGEEGTAVQQLIQQSITQNDKGFYSLGLWDVTILENGEEVQPQKPVVVTFSNIQDVSPTSNPVVLHVDEENAQIENMNASVSTEGEMTIETNHFSPYAVGQEQEKGTSAGSSEPIPEIEAVTEGQLAPYNRLQINDVNGEAELKVKGARVADFRVLKPLSQGGSEGDLWNGNWNATIMGPYPDFNKDYGAIAVQFQGANTKADGYSMGASAGWNPEDLSLETTQMFVTVDYKYVGTYDGKRIGASAEIKVTPMKNRTESSEGNSWEKDNYVGTYYPTIQISRSLYSGWDWQNVKEFHVSLTFYYLNQDGSFGEKVILNEHASPDYNDRVADYYTINSLNPAYIAEDGGWPYHSFGPEYVLPDRVQEVKAYGININGKNSNIVSYYDGLGYERQYAYNGGLNEWNEEDDKVDSPNWLLNSIMIIPPENTEELAFTMGNLMRMPDYSETKQKVPHTDNMWATFSSTALTQQQKIERTSVQVVKKWAGEEEQPHDPVEVSLMADGKKTGQTLTLSSENNWTGSFDNLMVYPDDDSTKPEIKYNVVEDSVPGYTAFYETASGEETGEDYWIPATEFEENGVYALVYSQNSAIKGLTNSSLSTSKVTKGTGVIELDGKQYTDYLTEVEEAALWRAEGTGNTAKLKNESTEGKLSLFWRTDYGYTSYYFATSDNGKDIKYSDSKLSATTSNGKRYYIGSGYSGVGSNNAVKHTLYKKATSPGPIIITITNRKTIVVEPEAPQFEHNKKIDYLGDGGNNGDTTLTGDDFYRLYLDMTGRREPTDLLIVIDRSASMETVDIPDKNNKNIPRDEAVSRVLNGYTEGYEKKEGLIENFLKMNTQNKYAVISFQGNAKLENNYQWKAANGYNYTKDSTDLSNGWHGGDETFQGKIDTTHLYDNGTNYQAGLERAKEMLKKVKDDGNRKIMIFLSDGVPTYMIASKNQTVNNIRLVPGDRGGTGGVSSWEVCRKPSMDAFDDLIATYSDLITYTVGVSDDLSSEDISSSKSPVVLEHMATNGGGKYFAVNSVSELENDLLGILYPSNVTITDHLSQYVSWYGERPDAKVTMTNRETGGVTTLYENGSPTEAGNGIVQELKYTDALSTNSAVSTGSVDVIFEPGYHLEPNYIYTLSFNVQATQRAYDDYKNNGYGNVRGDRNTDYGSNITSSGKPGYRSNESASVCYMVADRVYEETYQHPVIQVQIIDLNLLKKGENSQGPVLNGVSFDLYKATVDSGIWTKDGDVFATGITDSGGKLVFAGLMGGNYLLYETKTAAGYVLSDEPWHVTVANGTVTVTDSQGITITDSSTDPVYKVIINQKVFELPSTGGMGATSYIAGGLLLMMSAGLMYIYKRRREVMNP